jgi:hypothetical protein
LIASERIGQVWHIIQQGWPAGELLKEIMGPGANHKFVKARTDRRRLV